MKCIIFILLLLSQFIVAQTADQIKSIGSYIGSSFSDFEKDLKLKKSGSKLKFGLDNRTYDLSKSFIMVSEEEEGKIGYISYLFTAPEYNDKRKSEIWYNLVNKFSSDKRYEFVESFVADPADKITTDQLSFYELISLLRKSYGTDKFIYEVTFKNGNAKTKISCSPVSIGIETKSITYNIK